jgi:biopolymer transport protein ExbD
VLTTTALLSHPRESLVLVRADKVTRLERFVTLVDRVRGLGFRQVSLEIIRA